MKKLPASSWFALGLTALFTFICEFSASGQTRSPQAADAVQESQSTRAVGIQRPEQQLSSHDRSDAFKATNAPPSSTVFKNQPDEGEVRGFDFARDPLNAKKPMQTPEEITAEDKAMKPKVMDAQRRLLEKRYDLTPKLSSSRIDGIPRRLPVGSLRQLAVVTGQPTLPVNTPFS